MIVNPSQIENLENSESSSIDNSNSEMHKNQKALDYLDDDIDEEKEEVKGKKDKL